jgi:hypothetical protein
MQTQHLDGSEVDVVAHQMALAAVALSSLLDMALMPPAQEEIAVQEHLEV